MTLNADTKIEPLKAVPDCVDCLTNLARESVSIAVGQNSSMIREAESAASDILSMAENSPLSSPEIANRIFREIKRISRVSDPYLDFKSRELVQARNVYSRLKRHVQKDLRTLASLAALGNSFDFFRTPENAIAQISQQLEAGISFAYDHLDLLAKVLDGGPGLVLYFADNSGEVYFDLPLYEYIQERAKQTVLVVKGGPTLNDLTRAELRESGLEDRFAEVVDTGTDGVGIDWGKVSGEFLALTKQADLILSKGMANFETIYPRALIPAVFFLFKVKCRPVQDYIGAPEESYVALWKQGLNGPKCSGGV